MQTSFPLCASILALSLAFATAEDPRTITSNPAAAGSGEQVGTARLDGVTVTADDAYITRHGATERLTRELALPSGIVVRPDGTVTQGAGNPTKLRVTQLLTFDGRIIDLPRNPNENPGDPRTGGVSTGTTGPAAGGAAGPGASSSAGGNATGTMPGSSRSDIRERPAANGDVDVSGGGSLGRGVLNPDGSVVFPNGVVQGADGIFRDAGGNVIRNPGQIGPAAGATGTTGGAASRLPNNPANPATNTGTFDNGNTNPGVPNSTNRPTQTNNGVTTGSGATGRGGVNSGPGSATGTGSGPNSGGTSGGTSGGGAGGR